VSQFLVVIQPAYGRHLTIDTRQAAGTVAASHRTDVCTATAGKIDDGARGDSCVQNALIDESTRFYLFGNPLTEESIDLIPTLSTRGVRVSLRPN